MDDPRLQMSRCASCHAGYLPRPGACPRCGSTDVGNIGLPARGTVLAATELSAPATGWTAPHRLAFVEIVEGIRVLVVVSGALPAAGDEVTIAFDGSVYRIV